MNQSEHRVVVFGLASPSSQRGEAGRGSDKAAQDSRQDITVESRRDRTLRLARGPGQMAIFQILGLAPAKRVIRKWFRRLSPAGSQAGSSTGAASSSSTDTDTTTPSLSQHSRFSDSHQPPTMPTVVQVQTNAYPIEDKENRPPDGGLLAVELPTSLKKLSLQDVENLVPVAKTPLEHLQVENEVEEDPKVLAERARHLYFIGEALDMVRPRVCFVTLFTHASFLLCKPSQSPLCRSTISLLI